MGHYLVSYCTFSDYLFMRLTNYLKGSHFRPQEIPIFFYHFCYFPQAQKNNTGLSICSSSYQIKLKLHGNNSDVIILPNTHQLLTRFSPQRINFSEIHVHKLLFYTCHAKRMFNFQIKYSQLFSDWSKIPRLYPDFLIKCLNSLTGKTSLLSPRFLVLVLVVGTL